MVEKKNNIRVVLVEDEEVLLEVLESKLKKEGYEVFSAKDGVAGLDLVNAIRPDIILLDVVMPRMDGFEVLEHLQKDEELAKIPVIIISNSGQDVEIGRALALGVKDYLVKAEFDPQEVLDKIQNQLQEMGKSPVAPVEEKEVSPSAVAAIQAEDFRVLLVEDDSFLRDLLSQKMRKEKFQVIEAVDGEDGPKKTVSEKPHIVLLDLILPGADGFETLKRIRAEESVAQVPIIILSNLGQKDDIEKGMQLGATDYLVKAHNTPGEIIDKIRMILARSYK